MAKLSVREPLTLVPSRSEDGLVQTILKSYDLFNNDYFSLKASKESEPKYLLEYAFDRNIRTYYFTDDKDPHVEFIFKGVFNYSGIRMYGIYNPYVTDFDVVGSKDGKNYNIIKSYRNIGEEICGKLVLFECYQNEFYHRIRINFLRDSWNNISGSMFELDIFGTFLGISVPTCMLLNELSLVHLAIISPFSLIILSI